VCVVKKGGFGSFQGYQGTITCFGVACLGEKVRGFVCEKSCIYSVV
jgi:hypothetical protein